MEAFESLCDLAPGQVHGQLAAAADADPELAARLEELVACAARDGVLETPAVDHLSSLLEAESVDGGAPSRVGPYEIDSELGRGGMGVVYEARRSDGEFEQVVALKLVKRGLDSDEVLRRFRRERQILAGLEHAGIARLLDGGVTEDGQPYFAMERVVGEPIVAYCDSRRLPVRERLTMFMDVCEAVEHAHRSLVVHRDLKPSNVLATEQGAVKLLDFGIAKLLSDDDGDEATALTRAGVRVLTPEYAAPEQFEDGPVTTATDVYSLGVLLYELLTGCLPADGRQRSAQAHDDSSIMKPSRAAKEAACCPAELLNRAADRDATPVGLRRELEGDLDAIVMKALRVEPLRRYHSAQGLRSDVARFLAGHPVEARPDGLSYRALKFVRRHAVGVGASAVVLLSLVAGLVGTAWQAAAKSAEAEKAEAVKDFLTEVFKVADPVNASGPETTARELLERGRERIRGHLETQPTTRFELLLVLGEIHESLGLYGEALSLAEEAAGLGEGIYGAGSSKLASARRLRGAALTGLGDFEGAAAELQEAVLRFRESNEDAELAEALDRLGIALSQGGKLDAAESVMRESLKVRRSAVGAEARIADSLNNLGALLRQRGNYQESEERYEQALALRERLGLADHPDALYTENNLAALLLVSGRPLEARARFETLQPKLVESLGEEHPRTIAGLNNLAVTYVQLAEPELAEPILTEVLDRWRELGEEDHPNALMTRATLGSLRQLQGDLRAAEAELRSVLRLWKSRVGAGHPVTATIQSRLATVLRDRGAYDEADRLAQEALALKQSLNGADDPTMADELHLLGVLSMFRGDWRRAELLLREALDMRMGVLREGHVQLGESYLALGTSLRVAGDVKGAREALGGARRVLSRTLGSDHPSLARLDLELGRVAVIESDLEAARTHLQRAVRSLESTLGSNNWQTAEAKLALAACLAEQGDVERARAMGRSARRVLLASLGEQHRLVQEATDLLLNGSASAKRAG